MHIGKCVPMIALCLLLCGCKEQAEETDIRAAYREMSGCELTMKVVCGEAQREWAATLQCHYAPEGESTVEVTEPLELAGVRAVLREADWSLEYSDLCLNIGPLSAEQISPATVPVRMLNALREGWLLEENTEERQDIPCVRLALEQTGSVTGCPGDSRAVSGYALIVQETTTGLFGKFYIESDTHPFTDGKHEMALTLAFSNMMDEKEIENQSQG